MKVLKFKRSRLQRTNYKTRLKILLSHEPRLIVRPTLKDMVVQVAEYNPKGDVIKFTVRASDLRKRGWEYGTGNLPASYLCGYLAGLKAKRAGITKAILDIGSTFSVKGSRSFAVVKGCIEAGIDIPCSQEVLPSDDRVAGKHIGSYASSESGKSKHQFSTYKSDPKKIPEAVITIKEKISKEMSNG
ncbi:MAG: 50S ribosomal protein L18 [Nanoarchaeota archaeon]